MTIVWWLSPVIGRGTGLFTACYQSCWTLSPEFPTCGVAHCKCSCNPGLYITLWDLGTGEMVLLCWYSCFLVCCELQIVLLWSMVSLSTFGSYVCAKASCLGSGCSLPSSMMLGFFPDTGKFFFCHSWLLASQPLHTPHLYLGCPLLGLHACAVTSGPAFIRRAPHLL